MTFAEAFNVRTPNTRALFERAKRTIPGGAGSTARLPRNGWKPAPIFMAEGTGSRLRDVDGNTYIDYLLGLGPMILGHRHPVVTSAVQQAIAERGTCFGLPYELEIEAAEKVVAAVPGIEQVRFTNSGSEAVGTAVRLARATTGRRLIVRFEGHYHGWQDTVYWSNHVDVDLAGPADHPRPVAMGPGVPAELGGTLEVLTWNDPESFVKLMDRRGDEVAAVLTEPAVFNTGCILPEPGYLELLRSETRKHGAMLIFDEVITGFRFARGGAQEWFGVLPDLTTLAKGLGGGFPVAAVGGTTEAMRLVAAGKYSHSGTYNANVVQCAAVSATMDVLAEPGLYERQRALGFRLAEGLSSLAAERGLDAYVEGLGTVFQLWFADGPIRNWRDAVAHADEELFTRWYQEMLVRGVLFHPLQFENLFVSLVHDGHDIDETLDAAADALSVVATGRQPARTP
ncbi:glutamate-1-semialdehyde 2,1-aminomutase [Mycolicibacterium mageritense DSM 44476 = CIP 104973]|uniref:Glutamate-1-semialdehyde 2,1-aminomutase n=1 Tax=Mycolicibacterium mageritense TaxID=53462 RepID=A0AAI8TXT3_MYCME|nr:aspartate aminotransferase family protein [Mycolicibacterium mageritense]MBN3453684.1 aspartate aminotransferase family protein [Mycobacterium sp. DSM 3803]CDO24143.1 glutamate-1-semialdehyde 2,1-aminomutase [Mycolicibacterium mageritense DSM 44476 = CIP 104973]BBX36024.1 glutamate-1-semialdehyde 2,1-aminomutase [Mycolicibacterium mageritense]BDY30856.1 Glutamate-1-semialdehyde 2,1-aminomutase [Mycolicibacterium mageritense]GJJ17651.1 glutamate-1-semialdehyde 2,1-aminomutase [Mycolicibacter